MSRVIKIKCVHPAPIFKGVDMIPQSKEVIRENWIMYKCPLCGKEILVFMGIEEES